MLGFPLAPAPHTFLNNSASDVVLLVIGEQGLVGKDKVFYPVDPRGNEIKRGQGRFWQDHPVRQIGSHSGKPSC